MILPKPLKFILYFIIVVFVSLFTYLILLDIVVYNYYFLETKFFKWLFYLLPILTSFLLIIITLFLKKDHQLIQSILITLFFIYFCMSIFMAIGEYSEAIKNLNGNHILVVIFLSILNSIIFIKKILPKISLSHKILIGVSSLVVLIDFYFFHISYHLIY